MSESLQQLADQQEKRSLDEHQQEDSSKRPKLQDVINNNSQLSSFSGSMPSALSDELPVSLTDAVNNFTEGISTVDTQDTVLHNGVSIPKDSELFSTVDLPSTTELSPEMLVKANLASLPLSLQSNETLPIRVQFAINSIPLLDNISTQILRIIAVGPYDETLDIITNEEPTPKSLVFRDLVDLFENIKKIYSEEDPFLNLKHVVPTLEHISVNGISNLKEIEDDVDQAIRKANLATFLLATLGSIEVGFFFLNESFLDVFCPTVNTGWFKRNKVNSTPAAGRMLKAQAGLLLELKTQAYISALEAGGRSKEDILNDIFPTDLKDILLQRRQSTQLTPSEVDFLNRCESRRETLLNNRDDDELSYTYEWLVFLKELFNYVSKNTGFLLWGRKGRNTMLTPVSPSPTSPTTSPTVLGTLSKEEIQKRLEIQKEKERELKEREKQELERQPFRRTSYAKQVAHTVNKGGPPRIRNIMRRPWSSEEEAALVEALEEHGPHWAQILEFYGAGGKKSEDLKNRTQVQLKDKARNWKMAYLKNGNPVPVYLQKVTGELERDDRAAMARKKQRKRLQSQKQGANNMPVPSVKESHNTAQESSSNTNSASKESEPASAAV